MDFVVNAVDLLPPKTRLITADGNENLSGLLPRTVADVEAWMADVWAR